MYPFRGGVRIPGYLDFWLFLAVTKIPAGEVREIVSALPPRSERVTAELRYRDWLTVTDRDRVLATLARRVRGAAGSTHDEPEP